MDETTKEAIERLRDEDRRQNRRLEVLEQNLETQRKIATSVEKLALNMEQMLKEQEKQGERLTVLEKEPATRWNNMVRTIFNTIVGACAGAAATGIIYFMSQSIRYESEELK